ncbi:hypothetical protein A8L34_25880 [Bacillus sp. FJAT-27264]|uniref:ATP-binding protein n=1 Tax=Paenibacillus sp. (strain DSM 101736 / FJAT-27264) TaxID=1850362 RepID=UPI000807E32F|nr:ATP-binding protein [Bacillus sp. FJAT-27264]OBZ07565.1 hypothetical protein A8L34_25880 [Bacillus sp. FJAT-27264]
MRFTINTRVLEHLGRELITSDEVAIMELIKNCYDANALEANIHFIDNFTSLQSHEFLIPYNNDIFQDISGEVDKINECIIIEDNGDGMGLSELENGFFTIGTDIKRKLKESKVHERLPLGEKGIGRLAAQRLSNILFIETTHKNSDKTFLVKVAWNELLNNFEKLDEFELTIAEHVKKVESYTRFWLFDLNVRFNSLINGVGPYQLSLFEENREISLKEGFQSTLSFLSSPFDNDVDDFKVKIFHNNLEIPTDFQTQAINIAESEHSFNFFVNKQGELELDIHMKINPWFLERVHQRLTGNELFDDWRKEHTYYADLLKKYEERFNTSLHSILNEEQIKKIDNFSDSFLETLREIAPLEGKVYSFKRHNTLSNMAINSAKANNLVSKDFNVNKIREFLDHHNGIKLYRGNFRIATLGDKDSDWLRLQQARTKGQQFFRFELGNVIGYVKINDPYQNFIKEISSRQDIRQNEHSLALKDFLESIFNDSFYSFSRSAYYISYDIIKEEGIVPEKVIEHLIKEVDDANKVAEQSKAQLKTLNSSLAIISKNIQMNNEQEILEVQKAFEIIKANSEMFGVNIQSFIDSILKSKTLLKQVEHEKKLIELESYNNYKLMANGLITEVITHELHSLLPKEEVKEEYDSHIKIVEDYLLKQVKEFDLYSDHFSPLKERLVFFNGRMLDLTQFYLFLEKTFLYKGTIEDFETEDVKDFITNLQYRINKRLTKNRVELSFDSIDMKWKVPKGALIHVFYNLIDNSLYWINERQSKARYDKVFERIGRDFIKIEKKDESTIHYFDSGTGILPKYEHTLFHPLVTGKARNGRGMGLYIVRELLRSFNADIELLQTRNERGYRYIFEISLKKERDIDEHEE